LYDRGVSILEALSGETPLEDLSKFATSINQSKGDLNVTLSWHAELYSPKQPAPSMVVEVRLYGQTLWIGFIENISSYTLQTGTRTMGLTCRTRDASGAWRKVKRVTQEYPLGTRLDVIARDIAQSLGLEDAEISIPTLSVSTPHSNTQLAGISAWDMLETLFVPAGYSPRIDGLGRLSVFSRDVQRQADATLTWDRVEQVTGSRASQSIARLKLNWLDPQFTTVEQKEQVLAQANITAGYFQIRQRQKVTFGADGTQRAKNTHLVIAQSANSGLFDVCSEGYSALSETEGEIQLETSIFVPTLLGMLLAAKAAAAIPDIAPPSGGPTSPVGKKIQAGLEFAALIVMASVGTGSYEVWGTPYDFIKGRNTMEARSATAADWDDSVEEISNDFIMDSAHAHAVAAREFFYRALSPMSYSVRIVDDPRIQEGDILALPDGSRLYVTDYSRDLSYGAPAMLDVQGFAVAGGGAGGSTTLPGIEPPVPPGTTFTNSLVAVVPRASEGTTYTVLGAVEAVYVASPTDTQDDIAIGIVAAINAAVANKAEVVGGAIVIKDVVPGGFTSWDFTPGRTVINVNRYSTSPPPFYDIDVTVPGNNFHPGERLFLDINELTFSVRNADGIHLYNSLGQQVQGGDNRQVTTSTLQAGGAFFYQGLSDFNHIVTVKSVNGDVVTLGDVFSTDFPMLLANGGSGSSAGGIPMPALGYSDDVSGTFFTYPGGGTLAIARESKTAALTIITGSTSTSGPTYQVLGYPQPSTSSVPSFPQTLVPTSPVPTDQPIPGNGRGWSGAMATADPLNIDIFSIGSLHGSS
jgi:hypothetical protein